MTLDSENDDRVDAWHAAIGPLQPRPLSRPEPSMPRARRWSLLALIALGHAVGLLVLDYSSRLAPEPMPDQTTTLVFLFPEPAVELPAVPSNEPISADALVVPDEPISAEPQVRAESPSPAEPSPRVPDEPRPAPETPTPRPRRDPQPMVAVDAAPRSPPVLQLYEADGSLALPDDVVARLDEVDGDRRVFDFQRPGLMESGRFMDRQPVLVYEATRFDQYWIPEKDILTEVLEKAVEATTGTVEIPVPGSPGSKLVCTVSILAMGGGCGIRNKNDGYVVQLDDPDTLNPEEDAQCAAWWDQIVAASDQDRWRHTRALYEASCRKPLAKDPAPPE